eukprot:733049_1
MFEFGSVHGEILISSRKLHKFPESSSVLPSFMASPKTDAVTPILVCSPERRRSSASSYEYVVELGDEVDQMLLDDADSDSGMDAYTNDIPVKSIVISPVPSLNEPSYPAPVIDLNSVPSTRSPLINGMNGTFLGKTHFACAECDTNLRYDPESSILVQCPHCSTVMDTRTRLACKVDTNHWIVQRAVVSGVPNRCRMCEQKKPRKAFSKAQLKKSKDLRICKMCHVERTAQLDSCRSRIARGDGPGVAASLCSLLAHNDWDGLECLVRIMLPFSSPWRIHSGRTTSGGALSLPDSRFFEELSARSNQYADLVDKLAGCHENFDGAVSALILLSLVVFKAGPTGLRPLVGNTSLIPVLVRVLNCACARGETVVLAHTLPVVERLVQGGKSLFNVDSHSGAELLHSVGMILVSCDHSSGEYPLCEESALNIFLLLWSAYGCKRAAELLTAALAVRFAAEFFISVQPAKFRENLLRLKCLVLFREVTLYMDIFNPAELGFDKDALEIYGEFMKKIYSLGKPGQQLTHHISAEKQFHWKLANLIATSLPKETPSREKKDTIRKLDNMIKTCQQYHRLYGTQNHQCSAPKCEHRDNEYDFQLCDHCNIESYCSAECREEHWLTGHQRMCDIFNSFRRVPDIISSQ